jgi:hypothetical protein
VDDRIRTGDRLDHNQELYQLSYVHRAAFNLAGFGEVGRGLGLGVIGMSQSGEGFQAWGAALDQVRLGGLGFGE